MNLTPHFTLEELCHTDTGLPNIPNDKEKDNLSLVAINLLEPTRKHWGAIKVNCGFRCPEVNNAVGGVSNSQHLNGSAADIKPLEAPLTVVYDWMTKNLEYGQCILENKHGVMWIHISSPRQNEPNNEALIAVMVGNKMIYKPYEGMA